MVVTWIFPLPLFSPGPFDSPDPLDLSAQTQWGRASDDAYQLVSATPKGVATLSSPFLSAVVCYGGSSKYEVRCVHGQDDVSHKRQDSMN